MFNNISFFIPNINELPTQIQCFVEQAHFNRRVEFFDIKLQEDVILFCLLYY